MNVSEGRDLSWLHDTAHSLSGCVDLHTDPDHHRSVFTLLGTEESLELDVVELARSAVGRLNLGNHQGVHPRIGVLDVVPFVPLGSATLEDATVLRNQTGRRLAEELGLGVYLYGPDVKGGERTLPEVRRRARTESPDLGPVHGHPRAGAVAVGARLPLVAWNLWLEDCSLERAKQIAADIRSGQVRALGLQVTGAVQVSCNLLSPSTTTPAHVKEQVAARLEGGERIQRAELIGLVPQAVLDAIAPSAWASLDLSEEKTIEAAARRLGLSLI